MTIGGLVWHDMNANTTLEAGEPPFIGVRVNLVEAGPDTNIGTADDVVYPPAITNALGNYIFTSLPGGIYQVEVEDADIPSDLVSTTGEPVILSEPLPLYLNPGDTAFVDFGYAKVLMNKKDAVMWSDVNTTGGVLDVGDTVAFEIEIFNPSSTTGFTIDVTDPLPPGLQHLAYLVVPLGADTTESSPSLLSVKNIYLPPLGTETIIFTAIITIDAQDGQPITNTAYGDMNGDQIPDLWDSGDTDPVTNTEVPTPPDQSCSPLYIITTEAGDGTGGYGGDGGPATSAQLFYPMQDCVDEYNNVFVADYSNHVIRRIDNITGFISTVAGTPGVRGYSGDGGPALSAMLALPADVWVREFQLYIADMGNSVIRKVDLITGIITTVAGNGTQGFSGDGGPATAAQLNRPRAVYVDVAGNIYIGDTFNFCIRKVDAATGLISTIAGIGGVPGHAIDGDLAVNTSFEWIHDVIMSKEGILYFTEQNGYNLVRRIVEGRVETIAGQAGGDVIGDCGPAKLSYLQKPYALAFDTYGNLYIADEFNHKIRKIDALTLWITSIAGTGVPGYNGDDIFGIEAQLNHPTGVACGSDNILHIVDRFNQRVRRLNLEKPQYRSGFPDVLPGDIDTIAGTGSYGYIGDGPDARILELSYPGGLVVDWDGNIIFADRSNHRVRKIFTDWSITTIAGSGSPRGYSGDGGQATSAQLNFPTDVALDSSGNLYISDQTNHVIRKVDAFGVITTIAGTPGVAGYAGDSGLATAAQLAYPDGIAVFGNNLYISDMANHRLRLVNLGTGIITTVAGNGSSGHGAELVGATTTPLDSPRGVCVDSGGNVYIASFGTSRIRKLTTGGIISTVAGSGMTGYYGDGGLATSAWLNQPTDVCVDITGDLFIADYRNHIIRKVDDETTISTIAGTPGLPGYSGDGGPAVLALFNYPVAVALNGSGDMFISDRLNHVIRVIGK